MPCLERTWVTMRLAGHEVDPRTPASTSVVCLEPTLMLWESARKAARDKPERDIEIHQVVLTCDRESGRLLFFDRCEDCVLTGNKIASSTRPLSSCEVNQNMDLYTPNISNFSRTPACHTVMRHPGTKMKNHSIGFRRIVLVVKVNIGPRLRKRHH